MGISRTAANVQKIRLMLKIFTSVGKRGSQTYVTDVLRSVNESYVGQVLNDDYIDLLEVQTERTKLVVIWNTLQQQYIVMIVKKRRDLFSSLQMSKTNVADKEVVRSYCEKIVASITAKDPSYNIMAFCCVQYLEGEQIFIKTWSQKESQGLLK